MRTVTTVNSVYQINEPDHLIRRVHGTRKPTERQGEDGVWQSYRSITFAEFGLLIIWDDLGRATWTSAIVSDVTE